MTVVSKLATHKQRRIADLRAEAESRIVTEFEHDALGSPHVYPADRDSQINGQAAATLALDGDGEDMLCADANGVWDFRPHTAAQVKAVGRAWQQHKQAVRKAYQSARLTVEAATTRAEVDAVAPAWPSTP